MLLFILIRHPRCSPFKALRVLLVFEEPAELWSELLMMSGASSVRQHQAEKDSSGTYNTCSPVPALCLQINYQNKHVGMVTPLTLISPEGHGFNPPFPLSVLLRYIFVKLMFLILIPTQQVVQDDH